MYYRFLGNIDVSTKKATLHEPKGRWKDRKRDVAVRPNSLLIFPIDDFVTRAIVGVTPPIDIRNCPFETENVPMVVATFLPRKTERENWSARTKKLI